MIFDNRISIGAEFQIRGPDYIMESLR